MKPSTVFLGEMTNPELEEFLQEHQRSSCPSVRPSSTARTDRCDN